MHDFGILSLLPAFITILLALLTHRIVLALFLGIISGALIMDHSGVAAGLKSIFYYLYITFSDPERLKIAFFLLLVGGLLGIISDSGAYIEFAKTLSGFLNTARKVRLTTFILGIFIFFDDYASVLIAGTSMRSITKSHRISPALMAYIVDSVATVVSITLLSTWSAFESSLMVSAGATVSVKKTATEFLISSLPYHICTYSGLFLAFLVAFSGKWFGVKLDNLKIEEEEKENTTGKGAKFIHVFIPIITLIFCALGGLFYSAYKKLSLLSYEEINIINLLGDAPTINILILSTFIALLICVILLKKDKVMEKGTMRKGFLTGLKHMGTAALLIILSRGLSEISDNLGTGLFITGIFSSTVTVALLPAIIVIISALITIATGISWSSMAILMPIAYDMALCQGGQELIPVVGGAVISGAIFGGLLIPYSDTSVMAASAFRITPVYHTRTQASQIFTVFTVSILAYLLIGLGINLWIVYLTGICLLTGIHYFLAKESNLL